MNKDIDIEAELRRYRREPGAGVKRSVLSSYADSYRRGVAAGDRGGFWKRPMPLYAAAAMLVAAIGLSFLAGRYVSRQGGGPAPGWGPSGYEESRAGWDMSFYSTRADLLS